MAGPGCTILHPLSTDVDRIVGELVRLVAGPGPPYGDEFSVKDTRSIGGSYQGEGRPFILFTEPRDPEEIAEVERILGWASTGDIGLAAMCNRPQDHRILAEMALWLAERLAGCVDLGGEISYPPHLPGRAISIPYITANGVEAHYTLLDPPALRAWLSSPEFHMIK